jgi:hypothetical protein
MRWPMRAVLNDRAAFASALNAPVFLALGFCFHWMRLKAGESMSLGGTGDPPVLGGNLPPSFGTSVLEANDGCVAHAERRAGCRRSREARREPPL